MNDFELEPNALSFELYDDETDALWMINAGEAADTPDVEAQEAAERRYAVEFTASTERSE